MWNLQNCKNLPTRNRTRNRPITDHYLQSDALPIELWRETRRSACPARAYFNNTPQCVDCMPSSTSLYAQTFNPISSVLGTAYKTYDLEADSAHRIFYVTSAWPAIAIGSRDMYPGIAYEAARRAVDIVTQSCPGDTLRFTVKGKRLTSSDVQPAMSKCDTFLDFYRQDASGPVKFGTADVQYGMTKPMWKDLVYPLQDVCDHDVDRIIIVRCFILAPDNSPALVGVGRFTVRQLIEAGKNLRVNMEHPSGNPCAGRLKFSSVSVQRVMGSSTHQVEFSTIVPASSGDYYQLDCPSYEPPVILPGGSSAPIWVDPRPPPQDRFDRPPPPIVAALPPPPTTEYTPPSIPQTPPVPQGDSAAADYLNLIANPPDPPVPTVYTFEDQHGVPPAQFYSTFSTTGRSTTPKKPAPSAPDPSGV